MYLLFDIGGTKMRIALSEDGGNLVNLRTFTTPDTFKEGIKIFEDYYEEVVGAKEVAGLGGCITGVLDSGKNMLLVSLNLPGWVRKPIKRELESKFAAKAYLGNDAAFAGLGEAVFGSGQGYNVVAYLTISTGVGGVRVVRGEIDESSMGFEPGYQVIDVDASIDPAFLASKSRYGNKFGYLQRFVSGKDIEERFGKPASEIVDAKIWDEIAKFIAVGLNNTIVHWSPDIVILGGGVIQSKYLNINKISFYLREVLIAYPKVPEVEKVILGDNAALYGALAYLKQKR